MGLKNATPYIPAIVTQDLWANLFLERNARNLDEQWLGEFGAIVTEGALSSGSPLAGTNGIGKLLIVLNAGSDFDGTITVTGTKVDRNTGAETASFTDDIVIDALTTDDSDTDAESNVRHAFTGAYITSVWFKGAFTLSTTDVNLSDVDIYNIAFEQFNDSPLLTLQTFDATLLVTNSSAWFYAYAYLVAVDTTTQKANITRPASLELPAADTAADKRYRRRKGNITQAFDGSSDGMWIELFFGPDTQNYLSNISVNLWLDKVVTLG